jgi:hypothetical protein
MFTGFSVEQRKKVHVIMLEVKIKLLLGVNQYLTHSGFILVPSFEGSHANGMFGSY